MSTTVLDMFKLTGKTAVITGGTGGLGIDMAQALAEAGADIVSLELPNDPLSQNLREAIKPSGRKLTAFDCNVRNPQSIKDAFKAIKNAGIKLDILVNSAGVTRHMKVEETPVEDLNAVSAPPLLIRKDAETEGKGRPY
jgi:2-deoxy-D-gluconate 3-dehydrogenase